VQHAYIAGGDWQLPPRPSSHSRRGVRARLRGGRYRIAKIYAGQNEEPTYRSPLTEIGVRRAGSAITCWPSTAKDLEGTDDPYRLLRGKADRP
jgi:tricorn protease